MNVLKYAAGKYPTKQQSYTPYQDLHTTMMHSKSNASIMRVTVDPNNVEGETLVVLIGTYFDAKLQAKIDSYFTEGIVVALPDALLNRLWARRENRTQKAQLIPGTTTYKFEAHEPTRIGAYGENLPASPTILNVPDTETAMKTFDAIIAPNSKDTPSPLPVGSKVKMQTIPFIKGYQALHRQTTTQDVVNKISKDYGRVPDNATRAITIIEDIEDTVLRASTKYRFTPSALAMHHAVYQPGSNQWVEPGSHVWIELDQAINTPYGDEIKAIYTHHMYPHTEIERVIPEKKDKYLHDVTLKGFIPHQVHWSVDIITTRCQTRFEFTYDSLAKRWVFLGSHLCPYNQCKYIQEANIEPVCLPCENCKAACLYWSSWLHTAMLMIQGFYATSPSPTDFQVEPLIYSQEETVTVGKGKNRRHIKTTKTRHIDYYIVKFDASLAKQPVRIPASTEEKLAASHPNWLVTTDKGDVIWVRKRIAEYKRHYPSGYTTQHTETELVTVRSHPKYIPMLKPEKRKADKITKIIASQYESEANQV